jgi:hypothetical protein
VISRPFLAVDAAAEEYLIHELQKNDPGIVVRRAKMTTAGSARYILSLSHKGGAEVFAELKLRMINEHLTYIVINPVAKTRPQISEKNEISKVLEALQNTLALLRGAVFESFTLWLRVDQQNMNELFTESSALDGALDTLNQVHLTSSIAAAQALIQSPQRLGERVSWPEDDWAWEQVNVKKRPRREVRGEWLQRLSQKRPQLKDPERSFRHAVSPNRKGDRKPES